MGRVLRFDRDAFFHANTLDENRDGSSLDSPLFADGGGFTTTLVLKNMSSVPQSGQLHFRSMVPLLLFNSRTVRVHDSYVIPGNGIAVQRMAEPGSGQ